MVYDLRQAAILALTTLWLGCHAPQEAVQEPTSEPAEENENIGEAIENEFPAVPELESIRAKIDPNCSENGCIQAVEYFGAYDTVTLNEVIPLGVNILNGYSVWQVTYVTHNRQARATITLPFETNPPENGYHIVLNNPLTVGFASRCASGSSAGAAGLAAQFGAYGMIGVSVDYPGLGTEGSHPYLVAQSEAMSTLDGARATLEFMEHANVPISNRLAFAGLSQGGHATLSAAAMHAEYAPELDIRAFAAAAPSNLFLEQWTPYIETDGYHLTFYALIAYAWSLHYGYETGGIFYETRRTEIENAISTLCLFEEDETAATLWDALGTVANEIFSVEFIESFSVGNLESFPALETGFEQNRVVPFNQTAPIKIYQGTWDYTVPPEATQSMIESLRSGGMDILYEEIPLSGHLNTAFGYIITYQLAAESSRNWLKGQLDL